MIIDTFRNFIEIEGLKAKINQYQLEISKENKRISDLEGKRATIQREISILETSIHDLKLKELELDISALENKLTKFKSQINLVKNEKELTSITHEIEHTQKNLSQLEEQYFSGVEKAEEMQLAIADHRTFLEGSKKSLEEIITEVQKSCTQHSSEIQNLQMRVDALLINENPSYRNLYTEMANKFKTTSPCAFILNKNCSMCRINIDVNTVNNVEHSRSLELCPSCGRILLPKDLNLY